MSLLVAKYEKSLFVLGKCTKFKLIFQKFSGGETPVPHYSCTVRIYLASRALKSSMRPRLLRI